MPSYTGEGYASNSFVWTDFNNLTGYSSNGFVFLAGMLNGAYTIGTCDAVAHVAEEIPRPRVNVPKGMAAQLSAGFLTAFCFYIAIVSEFHDYRLHNRGIASILYEHIDTSLSRVEINIHMD